MATNTGRLDNIIKELERWQGAANEVLDHHVQVLLCDMPRGTSFGKVKLRTFMPAGITLDYVNALKMVRDTIPR
jgi:hypothetical protein